ncbi:hypothetical protein D3C72_2372720 [compost metagenome]
MAGRVAQVGEGRSSCTVVAAQAVERAASVGLMKKTRESGFFFDHLQEDHSTSDNKYFP